MTSLVLDYLEVKQTPLSPGTQVVKVQEGPTEWRHGERHFQEGILLSYTPNWNKQAEDTTLFWKKKVLLGRINSLFMRYRPASEDMLE